MKLSLALVVLLGALTAYANEKVWIGGRLQGILASESATESQDMNLRRVRVNLKYRPWEGHSFVYDVRNDKSNTGDKSDGQFAIGDAYWQIDINENTINNIRLFRAKVDVSYSQTSSSKDLFNPTRALVSEYASDYVVSNRRAVNIQANGNVGNLAYQVVISDGIDSNEFDIASGADSTVKVEDIAHQKLTYGAKLRYFFQGDAKKNKSKDTFYGKATLVSFGVGFFANDRVTFSLDNNREVGLSRSLLNVELSIAHGGFRILSEYFQFTDDIVDLNQTDSKDMVDSSDGYFAQAEYTFENKLAPYIGIEYFDQSHDATILENRAQLVGLNYYKMDKNQRFGIVFKKSEVETNAGIEENEIIQLYTMLDY